MLREALARDVALVTTLAVVGSVAAFAAVQQRAPDAEARAAVDRLVESLPDDVAERVLRGREVYVEQRCAGCHQIAGRGSPRFPLDGVGARLGREEIRMWIEDPQRARPGVRKPSYDLRADDLDGLVTYLEHLR